jgi:hypothetical protein
LYYVRHGANAAQRHGPHFESFQAKVLPVAQRLDVGIIAMKTAYRCRSRRPWPANSCRSAAFGDHYILDTGAVDPIDMQIHESYSFPDRRAESRKGALRLAAASRFVLGTSTPGG